MSNQFEILVDFLRRCGDEVEGRALTEPSEEVQKQLRALARGEVVAADRRELMLQLSGHPDWVERLALEVRALRPGRPAGS